jgi:hypothetical protein
MEGGKEQNFWPGFVDALSNVVLVMIFVVVVFVVTLFYYSQKLAEYKAHKYVEKREEETQIKHPAVAGARDQANSDSTSSPSDAPQSRSEQIKDKQIADLKTQVASLKAQMAGQAVAAAVAAVTGSTRSENDTPNHIIEVKAGDKAKTTETGAKVESTAEAIVLHFADESTTLDEATIKSLSGDVGPWVERLKKGQGRIVVSGAVGALGYTEGRRRAYYRAIAVRNQLIAMGVEPGRVVSRVVPGENGRESNNKVLLQFTTQDVK